MVRAGSLSFGLGVELFVCQQIEVVHRQAQFREGVARLCVGDSRFQAPLRAAEAITQRAVFLGVAELAQEATNVVRFSPGLFHQAQRSGEGDPAGLRVFEDTTLERAALPGPVRVDLARAIRAQSRARLAKEGDRRPGARNRHRQSERLHFLRVIARSELDVVEERAVAAQPASEAKLFTGVHSPPSR